ncbi:MAG TPA: porin family protein [Bacteroidetes bacterium]|nr:hypothetical protein BMS3Bbin04_00757 [bacterium BMS3Bbin04]HDO64769.1 porin family protein [Bacteroidota bacterium]HEX03894.1 porin family protein [Bacteroidota bacterium]
MRARVIVVAMMMLFAVGAVQAGTPTGFYAGAGADIFMFGDADALDAGGFSSTFIGFTPKVGYQINDMWGVNAGYKYFMTNEGDGGVKWTQTAISIAANAAPFKDGCLMPLYFIAGIDMVSWEVEIDLGAFGTVTGDDTETGIAFGAGYGWWTSDNFSVNPEVTYVTGDAGGINIEVGVRYYFAK